MTFTALNQKYTEEPRSDSTGFMIIKQNFSVKLINNPGFLNFTCDCELKGIVQPISNQPFSLKVDRFCLLQDKNFQMNSNLHINTDFSQNSSGLIFDI